MLVFYEDARKVRKMFCPKCGKGLSDDPRFCPTFGHALTRVGMSERKEPPRLWTKLRVRRAVLIMYALTAFTPVATASQLAPAQETIAVMAKAAKSAVISVAMSAKNGNSVVQGSEKNQPVLTARDYYKELYAAGGLDRMADAYACFEDDPSNEAFFIFGQSKDIREFMIADGTFGKLPKSLQLRLKKDFLIVRGYNKGVPWESESFLDGDEGSWISDQRMLNRHTPFRIRFTIDWQTLRYKWAVEVLNMDSTYRSEVASFGKCEEVPAGVRQHGNDDQ